jgi:tetratricopeptide (TPR) repeat protein
MNGSVHISELTLPLFGNAQPAYVRTHFGISSFGINAFVADEPGVLISEHDELGDTSGHHEELYFVSAGHAKFVVDGDEIDAPAGTYVFVRDTAARRAAEATEPETTIIVAGGKPGEAFTPSPWERSAPAFPYWATEEFEKAIELLTRTHAEHPEDPRVLYNLACAESRAGRREEAVAHLREAIEVDASFAELAESDSDLEAIRDEPEFKLAVAGKTDAAGSSA